MQANISLINNNTLTVPNCSVVIISTTVVCLRKATSPASTKHLNAPLKRKTLLQKIIFKNTNV